MANESITTGLVDMRELIKDQTSLALVYAEDGAYNSAGRVLRRLADDIEAHARRRAAEMEALCKPRPTRSR